MITQGQCRALSGYFFIFMLAVFNAGCGNGGGDSPPASQPPVPGGTQGTSVLTVTANAGGIVGVVVGQAALHPS